MLYILWQDLAALAGTDDLIADTLEGVGFDSRDDDAAGELHGLMTSMTGQLEMYLRDTFSFYADSRAVYFDPRHLNVIDNLFFGITMEYERADEIDDDRSLWRTFGLHGDDAVDYNASHPAMIVDIIQHVRKTHPTLIRQ